MFSSGWIWLVTDQDGQLGVIPTFGAGTLLVRSSKPSAALEEWQRLTGEPILQYFEDLPPRPSASPSSPSPATSSPVSGVAHGAPGLDPHTQARTIASMPIPRGMYDTDDSGSLNATKLDASKIGTTLFPLLCVSVHEHAWVGAGYGVWGKEEYMRRFWTVVDWAKVVKLYEKVAKAVPKY